MPQFFIERPIFAWVIAILIMLGGVLSIIALPVAQYPAIAPPQIGINAAYPGADAQTLEDSVTQVIEQQMTGLDGLRSMSSESNSAGLVTISLTFEPGVDPDIAQVQVQNKLAGASGLLPEEVQRQGITVAKTARNFLQIFSFVSSNDSMSRVDIADYISSSVLDEIARVPGVGETQLFGAPYAMRIWLNPDRLTAYGLVPADVTTAIREQNVQISAGQLGGLPSTPGIGFNATVVAEGRMTDAQQFRDILLRVQEDGAQVRLGDVARVELTGQDFSTDAYLDGKPAASLGIKLAAGANALETADAVRARLDELGAFFPTGLELRTTIDTAPFVRLSIQGVVQTLFEAIVLVFLVMFLFLQSFRATLIPTIAAPVVLLGTFGVLAAAGYIINTLTMFGMVLAIGLLVDDAIVVVENVERVMAEDGLSAKEATKKSMGQITSALFGVTTVLSAVFVPMAFFGGSVGVIYRQFSITIVSAMLLSLLVAMTLTPALCATLLKSGNHAPRGRFFGWFNRTYDRAEGAYEGIVGKMVRHRVRSFLVFVGITAVMAVLLLRLPTAFLPDEDQGRVMVQVTLPPGAPMEQTRKVMEKVQTYFQTQEEATVESVLSIIGFNFGGRGQNNAIAFVRLNDWSKRSGAAMTTQAVAGRASQSLASIKEARVFAFTPPAVPELGTATGFEVQLQDRGGQGHDALMAARNTLLGLAAEHPALARVRPGGQEDTAQLELDIDHEKAAALQVPLSSVTQTLATAWGGSYVNDFIDRGRVKKVYVQGDAPYRMRAEDLGRWYVRNTQGEMVPFSSFAVAKWKTGSPRLERFNGIPAVAIMGEAAPGRSTGEAMAAVEEIASQLPAGFGLEWSGVSYEERLSGSQAPALYGLSLLVIFLCLAALYESWSIPLSVLLVVPLGVVGTVLAAFLFGLENDAFFQVGLLTIIGLSAKNAILIVEFARELRAEGAGLVEATIRAARLRLRPIIMTSMAFILGVVPLAISSGAGAGGQNAIGIGVIGGMLSGTFLAVLFVPVFFVGVVGLFERLSARSSRSSDVLVQEKAHV